MRNFFNRFSAVLALGLAVACVAGALPVAAKDKDTLIVAYQSDVVTLDPTQIRDNTSGNLRLQVFNGLIVIDEKGEIQPDLAERWEQPDPTTYVFYLKKGVTFHNGETFKADDVKFSIERALSPLGVAIHSLIREVKEVNVIDDYTVEIKLKNPFTPFLYSLGESWGAMLNKKAVEATDPSKTQVGTGPFKFVSWTKGDRVVLERFDGYHGEKPAFKNLVIRSIPEASSRVIELESGGVDIAYQIINPNDVARIEESGKLEVIRSSANRASYMGFNTSKAPFSDVRLRRAVHLAIDWMGMQKVVMRGVGVLPAGPLPLGIRYSDKTLPMPQQDVEAAKKLIQESGVKLPLKVELWVNESRERVDAATVIQNMLAEVGIEVDIRVMEWGALLAGLQEGKHDLSILGWGNNLPDPEFSFSNLFHSIGAGKSNTTFFKNKEFDALLEKGVRTPDGPEREAVYKDVQALFMQELPAVYWSVDDNIVGLSKRVKGLKLHPKGFYPLWTITLEE